MFSWQIKILVNYNKYWSDNDLRCGDVQEIGQLQKLTELDVSENKLVRLPTELGELINVTDLRLSYNHLEQLPDSIGMCHSSSAICLAYGWFLYVSSLGCCWFDLSADCLEKLVLEMACYVEWRWVTVDCWFDTSLVSMSQNTIKHV